MPSDNLSLGFLIPSRTFLCPLYKRHTPPRRTRVCVCFSLSRLRGALSLSPRVSLSLSRRVSRPLGSSRSSALSSHLNPSPPSITTIMKQLMTWIHCWTKLIYQIDCSQDFGTCEGLRLRVRLASEPDISRRFICLLSDGTACLCTKLSSRFFHKPFLISTYLIAHTWAFRY